MEKFSNLTVNVTGIKLANDRQLAAIAGCCAIESEELTFRVAETLKDTFTRLGVGFIFKASFDKANRSSGKSWRGLGAVRGLEILGKIKDKLGLPILTDIHESGQAALAAKVADVIQIPAFLCRQTDLLTAAAATGKAVNIKKGQFLSPWEMANAVAKIESAGNRNILLTERGFMFGYNNLVVDMRSLVVMKQTGYPVIYDATHSQQLPGGHGESTSGRAEFIEPVARAASAIGIAGIFFETHPDPDRAKSDGPNSIVLDKVEDFWKSLMKIDAAVK
ncbi:MAG: 3-deoxy-8-phosphooctulonate synthase [Elusimicrobia bacterium]|nr:3-deoxy-8-phosphooctulonate synthase [Elusimicrobiota bacterium]